MRKDLIPGAKMEIRVEAYLAKAQARKWWAGSIFSPVVSPGCQIRKATSQAIKAKA
jgi:hypothetical protein